MRPSAVGSQIGKWRLVKDEFIDNDHQPRQGWLTLLWAMTG